ncbi:hypothetical protein BDF14DRAFT_1808449 [Spinellus fusiger]|nr:hypothetical protein BDF14DRAFT_1808449 [Spinellus fusiger]
MDKCTYFLESTQPYKLVYSSYMVKIMALLPPLSNLSKTLENRQQHISNTTKEKEKRKQYKTGIFYRIKYDVSVVKY